MDSAFGRSQWEGVFHIQAGLSRRDVSGTVTYWQRKNQSPYRRRIHKLNRQHLHRQHHFKITFLTIIITTINF